MGRSGHARRGGPPPSPKEPLKALFPLLSTIWLIFRPAPCIERLGACSPYGVEISYLLLCKDHFATLVAWQNAPAATKPGDSRCLLI